MEEAHGTQQTAARHALDGQIAGWTLCGVLASNARLRGARPALRYSDAGRWRSLTWRTLRRNVGEAALGLAALGVGRGDTVLVRSPPSPEALVLDLAALHVRATPVFCDPGATAEQVAWIARHCGARLFATVGPVYRAPGGVADVVALDAPDDAAGGTALPLARVLREGRAALAGAPERLEDMSGRVRPDDVATLCYGPTPDGGLRAVVVTHRAALRAAASICAWAGRSLEPGDRTVAYLPLSHSAGRVFGHYLLLWSALEAYCCPVTDMVLGAMADARPSVFVGVPLVWERLARAVERTGGLPPGLEACRLPVSAGGPLHADLAERVRRAGVPLLDMYGLTETFGPVTAHAPGRPRAGTVGVPLPGLEVVIEDGEVVVRPGGGAGYFRDPAATARVFGAGGTVRTADLGYFDAAGHLVLTGRKRELLVTAGGRNIAPRPLERALAAQPGVSRACVLAEGRPFVAALLAMPATSAQAGATADGPDLAAIAVEHVNARLARGDRVRAFRAVPDDWSAVTGELRADGSCDRETIERRYARLVDELYAPGGRSPVGAPAVAGEAGPAG